MSNDWWTKKLNGASAPARPAPTAIPQPSSTPVQQPVQPQPVSQQFVQQPPTKAQSVNQTQTCPECYSGNYMTVQNAAPRCYDCGYPISQSGSHLGTLTGAKVEGPTKEAMGNATQNNWNPQGIIGRVD
jgi:hypothetical protein